MQDSSNTEIPSTQPITPALPGIVSRGSGVSFRAMYTSLLPGPVLGYRPTVAQGTARTGEPLGVL